MLPKRAQPAQQMPQKQPWTPPRHRPSPFLRLSRSNSLLTESYPSNPGPNKDRGFAFLALASRNFFSTEQGRLQLWLR
jgi:hypothetical protein